jgi:hypothetical protein
VPLPAAFLQEGFHATIQVHYHMNAVPIIACQHWTGNTMQITLNEPHKAITQVICTSAQGPGASPTSHVHLASCMPLALLHVLTSLPLLSCSGDEQVGERSTMPAKHTGVGSWIMGNSVGVLQGVDYGDSSGVMISSALQVQDGGHK